MARKNPAAVALGRLGGRVGGKSTSAAKVAAARLNGRKGGRPRGTGKVKQEVAERQRSRRALLLAQALADSRLDGAPSFLRAVESFIKAYALGRGAPSRDRQIDAYGI